MVADVKEFTGDIDDTEAYYEDARMRLRDVWKLFANKDEPSEDAGGRQRLAAVDLRRQAVEKDEFRPRRSSPTRPSSVS